MRPIPKARLVNGVSRNAPARALGGLHPSWSILRGRFAAPRDEARSGPAWRRLVRGITLECMEMRLNWRRNAIELTTHRRLRGAFLGLVRLARVGFLRRSPWARR